MPRAVFDLFLSSTSSDLAGCRAKVREMVTRLRQTTIAMETFGAKPNKPFDTCRDEVKRCDALIVLVGHRYGWVPSQDEGGDGSRSITWWEVQWALDAEKPVYAFLIDPKAQWNGEREQDRLVAEHDPEKVIEIAKAVHSLQEFRAFLEKKTTRELFTSADDISGKVAGSLFDWLLTHAASAAGDAAPTNQPPRMLPRLSQGGNDHSIDLADHRRWQEQAYLWSARALTKGGDKVRIALLAGRANHEHPELSGAILRQLDIRRDATSAPPDSYTTALASILVGSGQGDGTTGIAPLAHLLILQVVDENGEMTSANLLAAIDAAVREGAQVICLPLGGYSSSDVERQAYVRALELGIVLVCAAGNAGTSKPIYPAAYPGCIGVAAVDTENRLAPFASFGKWVTVAAPGVDVPGPGGPGESRKWSGSSFACAIVTGVVALMLERKPKLDPDSIRRILGRTGPPVLPGGVTTKPSHLRLVNAAAALRAAIEEASPPDGARRDDPAVARGVPRASRRSMTAAPKRRKKRDVRRFK